MKRPKICGPISRALVRDGGGEWRCAVCSNGERRGLFNSAIRIQFGSSASAIENRSLLNPDQRQIPDLRESGSARHCIVWPRLSLYMHLLPSSGRPLSVAVSDAFLTTAVRRLVHLAPNTRTMSYMGQCGVQQVLSPQIWTSCPISVP